MTTATEAPTSALAEYNRTAAEQQRAKDDQAALDAAVAAERERRAKLQQVWEDTRTQRDELLAHIAGKAPLPQWAADWLRA